MGSSKYSTQTTMASVSGQFTLPFFIAATTSAHHFVDIIKEYCLINSNLQNFSKDQKYKLHFEVHYGAMATISYNFIPSNDGEYIEPIFAKPYMKAEFKNEVLNQYSQYIEGNLKGIVDISPDIKIYDGKASRKRKYSVS